MTPEQIYKYKVMYAGLLEECVIKHNIGDALLVIRAKLEFEIEHDPGNVVSIKYDENGHIKPREE